MSPPQSCQGREKQGENKGGHGPGGTTRPVGSWTGEETFVGAGTFKASHASVGPSVYHDHEPSLHQTLTSGNTV